MDDAAPICLELYRESESLDHLERAFDSDTVECGPYLDAKVEARRGQDAYSPSVMGFLVRFGRVEDFEKNIQAAGYNPERWHSEYDFPGNISLFTTLTGAGRRHSAAMVARHVIDGVLAVNDNKNYERIVNFIRVMDADKGFEEAVPPHSEYMANLFATTHRKTKFWGIHKGTYMDKSESGHGWY